MSDDDLQLATDRVDEICEAMEMEISEAVRGTAKELARRADYKHPINRSPDVVAASAVYLAGLLENEKVTQKTVAEAAEVSIHSIRQCYRELFEHESIADDIDFRDTVGGNDGNNDVKGVGLATGWIWTMLLAGFAVLTGGVILTQRLLVETVGIDLSRQVADNAPTLLDVLQGAGGIVMLAFFILALMPYLPGKAGKGGGL
jgi:hypothetical protein